MFVESSNEPKGNTSSIMAPADRKPPAMHRAPMSPEQVKAGRKLLRWSVERLGAMSGTSAYTVMAYEDTGHIAKVYGQPVTANPVDSIQATLEAAGIEVVEKGGVPRVRLRAIRVAP